MSRCVFRAGVAGRFASFVVIVVPALVLVLLFGVLLSNGNAVFGLWTGEAFQNIWRFLPDPSCGRLVFWAAFAMVAIALLWPSDAPVRSWNWAARFERWPDLMPAELAFTASVVPLAALNVLFAVANYADTVFLWQGGTLPAGVTYSAFVHEGVEMLIVTVLLSALVLASIFNQPASVAGRRGLKILGGIWIAQNLFLLGSTARRMDLYLEAYGASVERFSTLIFLVLVAVGFGLLAVKIFREKSLAWLVGKAALVSFATLYFAQFLNLGGWAADYNVDRWARDHTQELDGCYLRQLGPAAWPALGRARKLGAPTFFIDDQVVGDEEQNPHNQLDLVHWREFSLRAWWNRDALKMVAGTDKK
jgi:hypothetical protein